MIKNMFRQIKRLYSFAGPARMQLITGAAGMAVNRLLLTIMTANLLRDATNALTQNTSIKPFEVIVNALPVALSIMFISAISTYLTGRACSVSTAHMRKKLMEKLIQMPLKDKNEKDSAVMLSYLTNDVPIATKAMASSLEVILTAFIQGIGSFVYVLLVSRLLALYVIILGVLTFIYSVFLANKLYRVSVLVQKQKAVMLSHLKNILDGTVVSKIYNMQALLYKKFDFCADKAMKSGIKWARLSGILGCINNFASNFSWNLLIFLSGLLLFANKLNAATVLWVSQMGTGVISIFHISRILSPILQSLAGAQRVFNVMDTVTTEPTGQKSSAPGYTSNAIEFANVSFEYSRDRQVIKNLSFSIKNGEMVAITGASGIGKTTVFRLIQGLYKPSGGIIDVFGLDIAKWNLEKLRNIISLVTQDNTLLTGSIMENISLGNKDFTYDDIVNAAKLSGAHEFIMCMPEKYDTIVSERGNSLSGGEKQRISIARALLRNSPILLLDEPTSALDSDTESVITRTLFKLKGHKTIVIVAHKPQTISIADRAIEIKAP